MIISQSNNMKILLCFLFFAHVALSYDLPMNHNINNQTLNNNTVNNQTDGNYTNNNQTEGNYTNNNQIDSNYTNNNQIEGNYTNNNQTDGNCTNNNQTDDNYMNNNPTMTQSINQVNDQTDEERRQCIVNHQRNSTMPENGAIHGEMINLGGLPVMVFAGNQRYMFFS